MAGCRSCPRSRRSSDFLRERADGLVVARVDLGRSACSRPTTRRRTSLAGLRSPASPGTASSSTSTSAACTWSSTWPAPAGCAGRDALSPRRRGRARGRWRCGCTSTTAPASTSPRRAPRSGSPSTSCARRTRCRASPGSGPDPLADGFDLRRPGGDARAAAGPQVKGLLRDQSVLAGVGNAYSDEVLHAARLSPFAAGLEPGRGARWTGSTARCRRSLRDAVGRPPGKPARAQGGEEGRHAGARPHRVSRARCAATPCARCPSPTPRCSTAPPARPGASRSPTGGCRGC